MSTTLELTQELISRRSVTPADEGCQDVMSRRLESVGFNVERLRYGIVDNIWARRGTTAPVLCFAGHTDVVPTGPLEEWKSDPFAPTVRDGVLYGRGAADMKSGLAAMVTAAEQFAREHPEHQGSIAFLITSDEEGPSVDGTKRVMETLNARNERIDWCVVGEPSSREKLGDLIRVGRRGSLTGRLLARGVQGHVAYPDKARNPIHAVAPAFAELAATRWDDGDDAFPPTSFQISNINAGTGADNVIPGDLRAVFNFRYGTASAAAALREKVEATLARHSVDFEIDWWLSGEPFLTPEGALRHAVVAAIGEHCGLVPEPSTGGGTSDGRFIAPLGAEVVELGPVNASIHKVNESVALAELEALPGLFASIARRLMAPR